MNKRYLFLLALLASLTGCVPVDSLNPLYTDKDVIFDESLLGFWIGPRNGSDGGLEISTLDEGGKKAYVLTMFDGPSDSGGEREVFYAHMVKLGGRQFLDVVPKQWDARLASYSLQVKTGKGGTNMTPRLLKLSTSSYLEFSEGVPGDAGNIQANLRRAHWIMRLSRDGAKLRLDWADDDDLRRAIQAGTVHLPTALLGEGKSQDAVITATTAELQKFVAEHADDKTFFGSSTDELHRKE